MGGGRGEPAIYSRRRKPPSRLGVAERAHGLLAEDIESSERGAATLRAFRAEIELLCRAVGVLDIHDLTTDDLATLDSELAAHTAIRHA